MKSLLMQYCYLQMLDVLTTVAVLRSGLYAGNPILHLLIQNTPSPWHGLLLVKLVVLAVGIYCYHIRRGQLLQTLNVCYAFLIVWNIVALIIGSRTAFKAVGGRVS
jgi:hypothetical protein